MIEVLELYVRLIGLVLLGFVLGRKLPPTILTRLGQFLFWIGIPLTIVTFIHKADLSGQIWIAPAIADSAILLGWFLAWIGIKLKTHFTGIVLKQSTQGSLILASMIGNTGYIGYPVTLAVAGTQYFAWALFYDLLGSALGAYGLGVALASRFGGDKKSYWEFAKVILINPALWSFGLGLLLRQVVIPTSTEFYLEKSAWCVVTLSLSLIGMRLAKLNSWHSLPQASMGLTIKMIIVPLTIGSILPLFGITGIPARVIILQMAMPPAFATLVLAETFNLDRDLAVTSLAVGFVVLLLTIPIWLFIF